MKLFSHDIRVREAKMRLNEERIVLQQLRDELSKATHEAARVNQLSLDAEAGAIVGDVSKEDAEAAVQAAKEAEEKTFQMDRRIETHERAVKLLEGKVQKAEIAAIADIQADLEAKYEESTERLARALAESQAALDDVVEVMAQFQPNRIETPRPHLHHDGKTIYIGNGGSAHWTVDEWLIQSGVKSRLVKEKVEAAKKAA